MSDNTDVPAETLSRRQALKTYVPPAITVIGLANVTALRSSGPISRSRKRNTRVTQVNTNNQNQTVTQTNKQTVTQHVTLTQTNNQDHRGSH